MSTTTTTTTTHTDTVTRMYQCFGAGDIPGILEHLDPDIRWEHWDDNSAQQAGIPILQARTGRDAAAGFFVDLQPMTFHRFEPQNMMVGGNQVAVTVSLDASIAGGSDIHEDEIHLWTFGDDGKVIAFRHYLDTAKLIAAWPS